MIHEQLAPIFKPGPRDDAYIDAEVISDEIKRGEGWRDAAHRENLRVVAHKFGYGSAVDTAATDQRLVERLEQQRKDARHMAAQNIVRAEIPAKYVDWIYDKTADPAVAGAVDEFYSVLRRMKDPKPLVIWGPSGVGKTHAAADLLRLCLRMGDGYFLRVPAFVDDFSTWGDSACRSRADEATRRAMDAPVLVLDDFGKVGKLVEADGITLMALGRRMYKILDYRRGRSRRNTILTMEHNPLAPEFKRLVSESLANRITDGAVIVEATTGYSGQRREAYWDGPQQREEKRYGQWDTYEEKLADARRKVWPAG